MNPIRGLVLVVEDEDDIRDALAEILISEGYRVVCARNGRDAINRLQDMGAPAVILLDLMMPVMNGWQFRSWLAEDASLSETPVIVLTADGRADIKAIQMGAVAGLSKPPRLEQLLPLIAQYCPAGFADQPIS